MKSTAYIDTSHVFTHGLSNPTEVRTAYSTVLCRSPVTFFSENSCVINCSISIVVENLPGKVQSTWPIRKTIQAKHFGPQVYLNY